MHSQDVVLGHFDKTGVYAGHCFNIHLLGGGQCQLVRDSEPIRLLEMPTSPSLYMLIHFIMRYISHFKTILSLSFSNLLLITQLLITQLLITQFLITQFRITQLLITQLLIIQFLIIQLLITQLLISQLLIAQLLITQLLITQLLIAQLLITQLLIT